MLLLDAPLTMREFATGEDLTLATVWRELGAFLLTRDDVVLFGSHAVNAYVSIERMTSDVDLMSTSAERIAEEICDRLTARFQRVFRARSPNPGAFRIEEVRQPEDRHLVDVRQVTELPPSRTIEGIKVLAPADLVATKVISMVARARRDKGLTDEVDLHRLIHALPGLGVSYDDVADRLKRMRASDAAVSAWLEAARQPLEVDDDDEDKFDWTP
jgi:hypothetical protein